MPAYATARLYATLKATPQLHEAYNHADRSVAHAQLTDYTKSLLGDPPYQGLASLALIRDGFKVVGAPSNDWKAKFVGDEKFSEEDLRRRPPETVLPDELICIYEFANHDMLMEFQEVVHKAHASNPNAPITGVGTDLGVEGADHWSPGTNSLDSFGRQADAHQTVAAGALGAFSGRNVNVVVMDQGLNAAILGGSYGGGLDWAPPPPDPPILAGSAPRTSHGMMLARTILGLAPQAKLYDVPLIPQDRIASVPLFTGLTVAQAAFWRMVAAIWLRRLLDPANPQFQGPWIFVNAWAIFDRSTETIRGDYTENLSTSPGGHPLIALIRNWVIAANHFDVIFAAGNCGDFDASPRCGERDRGPGHSIWGANALAEVITAGAVSSAETWIGYSSQGPGPAARLAAMKPDLCAPSNFRDDSDAALLNSGTSTACAMTAGVVAALRSNPRWSQYQVPPAQMHAALTSGARKTLWPAWDERLGHGILDAQRTISRLPT
jgi:hypothetical protein